MAGILRLTKRLRLAETQSKKTKTNVIDFPIMEKVAKTCDSCGLPYSGDRCPDCWLDREEDEK